MSHESVSDWIEWITVLQSLCRTKCDGEFLGTSMTLVTEQKIQ